MPRKDKEKNREYARVWRARNPEKLKEYQRRYREKYPERVKEIQHRRDKARKPRPYRKRDPAKKRAYHEQYYARYRDRLREARRDRWHNVLKGSRLEASWRLKKRYGISIDEFDAIVAAQGGMCALCRKVPPRDVDHCHTTHTIRGLLCRRCNVGLGLLGDTIEGLNRAIAYLQNGSRS